jgi:hypothetical protein
MASVSKTVMVQLPRISIEKPNFYQQKLCHASCRPWLSDPGVFFVDNIVYVSYFLTDNVAIQLTPSALDRAAIADDLVVAQSI